MVCQNSDPMSKMMDCDVTLSQPTTNFTLTAYFIDGSESPHSAPFPFTDTVVKPKPILNSIKFN